MFDKNSQNSINAEDIFSNVDKKPDGEVEVPAKINYSPVSSDNNSLPLEEINSIQFKPKSNKILTIIIIFLAVILFGLAGFWIYAQYIKQDKEVSFDNLPNNSEQNIGNILENLSKELEQPVAEKPEEILPPATEPEPKIPSDIDKDGLSDEEEILLGTNPSRADTDLDGLSDYDEVKVYFTNPIKNDTDGDGYMDGIEVQNGYDPNGPGKLGTEERSATEWKEYIDDRYNFKIKYPKGWYYAKYSEGTTVVSFDEAASLADLSKESAKHKLHIVAEENTENLNIKEWIESYYGDISYLNIKYVTIDGYDAVQIDGAPTMYNEVIETHIVKNGKVFIFRMIGNGVNDPKISPQNREYYNEIISSIKFN